MHDVRCVMHDVRCVMHDAWCTLRDAWCTLRDAWCTLRDAWCTLRDAWCMMHVAWCMMHDACCMLHDAWCMIVRCVMRMHDAEYMVNSWLNNTLPYHDYCTMLNHNICYVTCIFKYYLQYERPCYIGYTISSRRREVVYPIQHGREYGKVLVIRTDVNVRIRRKSLR